MSRTRIEWCTHTWNPLRVRSGGFGCTKVSPGCLNCYAGRMNKRLFKGRDYDYQYKPTDFYLDEKTLEQPLHWRKPRTVFVCSMCDLFHENVPDQMIAVALAICIVAEQHTFLILTKRPERMAKFFSVATKGSVNGESVWPASNIWLGVTAENQEEVDKRIPTLLSIPAAKHFISVEPMLGPVDLFDTSEGVLRGPGVIVSGGTTKSTPDNPPEGYDDSYPGIDWVIAGCESGPGARPANIDWFRSLRDQCVAADVPFFLKQMVVDGKITKLPLLDGQRWEQRPE